MNEFKWPGALRSLALVGDSLPAFGIVAAVMGVVHALASADRPAAELRPLRHALRDAFAQTPQIEGDLFGGVAAGLAVS